MKIGIFVEYLYTAGGGERHILTVAEHLSKDHKVFLITRNPVNLKDVEQKLDLDLSRTKVVYWPEVDDEHASDLTEEYDIFINSTIFSSIPNKSENGIAMIFFPIVINYNYPIWLKKLIYKSLEVLYGPRDRSFYLVGKHRPVEKRDWRIRENKIGIIFEKAIKNLTLEFIEFDGELSNLVSKVLKNKKEIKFEIQNSIIKISEGFKENDELEVQFNDKNIKYRNKDEQVYNEEEPYYLRLKNIDFTSDNLIVTLINRILKIEKRNIFIKLNRIYTKQKSSFLNMNYLKTYKLLWANSKYTQKWIKRIYNLDSEILYPPIDVRQFKVSKNKKNIITSVGRFFPPQYGHNKKQLEMIKFFKDGFDRYEEFKNYEYHLCGGMKNEEADIAYVEQCKKEAEGYPVFIHENIPFQDLIKLCSESKIFWHAAGFGEDQEKSPELFEHFGMTTVENMSAGSVPIAINAGGQIEIIQEGENGFRWNTESELHEKTLRLMKDEELREKMSKKAIESSKQYSKDEVIESLEEMLKRYLIFK